MNDSALCGAQYPPLLMFMSDGGAPDGEDEMDALHTKISGLTSELLVKTFAFGEGADTGKLQALATAGRGEFLLAVDGMQLKECFEKTAASLVKTYVRSR